MNNKNHAELLQKLKDTGNAKNFGQCNTSSFLTSRRLSDIFPSGICTILQALELFTDPTLLALAILTPAMRIGLKAERGYSFVGDGV